MIHSVEVKTDSCHEGKCKAVSQFPREKSSVFLSRYHTRRTNMTVTVIQKKRRKNKFIRSKLDLFAAMVYYIQSYLLVNESNSVQKVLE